MKIQGSQNIYINSIIMNSIPLVPFLLGLYLDNAGLLMFGIAFFWLTAILGTMTLLFPKIVWEEIVKASKKNSGENNNGLLEKSYEFGYIRFNVVYDLVITFILAFTGFGILAAIYTIHIPGYLMMYDQIRKVDQAEQAEQDKESDVREEL